MTILHNKKRAEKIFKLYQEGQTLQKIGDEFNITRERVRQILEKVAYQILAQEQELDLNDSGIRESLIPQVQLLKKQISFASKEIRHDFEDNQISELIKQKMSEGIRPENFFSVQKYSEAIGMNLTHFCKHCPDIVQIIQNNRRKRWSTHYAQCRMCGTTYIKHRSLGYCRNCYPRSKEVREMQMFSHYKNYEKRKTHIKEYSREYAQRDYVKKRSKIASDIKIYDGNREKAIERDKYKCVECGINREDCQERYGKDFFIRHIDNDKTNNNLENLKTLCYGCFQKIIKW